MRIQGPLYPSAYFTLGVKNMKTPLVEFTLPNLPFVKRDLPDDQHV